MAKILFPDNLQRYVDCELIEASGATLREVLDGAFRDNTEVQAYVLDEQGAIHNNVAVFIDGMPVQDRRCLTDAVLPTSEVYVMQAQSG